MHTTHSTERLHDYTLPGLCPWTDPTGDFHPQDKFSETNYPFDSRNLTAHSFEIN